MNPSDLGFFEKTPGSGIWYKSDGSKSKTYAPVACEQCGEMFMRDRQTARRFCSSECRDRYRSESAQRAHVERASVVVEDFEPVNPAEAAPTSVIPKPPPPKDKTDGKIMCGCCASETRGTLDYVTGKPLCNMCARVIPRVRAGELDIRDDKVKRQYPVGYTALVSRFVRDSEQVPASDVRTYTRW